MNTPITGSTFYSILKEAGVNIPDNTVSISLVSKGYKEAICLVYHTLKPGTSNIFHKVCDFYNESDERVDSTELYNLLNGVAPLPEHCVEFSIEADFPDGIVYVNSKSCLTQEAAELLGNYKFVNRIKQ